MVRISLIIALEVWIAAQGVQLSASSNTFFWLSSQGWPSSKGIPSLATIPEIYNFNTQGSSSLYLWARPEMGETLKNWSVNLVSTNPNILTFDSATVFKSDVTGETRWQYPDLPGTVVEPTGNSTSIKNITGFTISSGSGVGIGPNTINTDRYYNQTTDAWLLARVDYSLMPFSSLDSADLFLQIGSFGMTNTTGTSADVDVVFGHSSETPLINAKTKRQMNSSVRDAMLHYYPKPDADFDGDTDVDGRDFLIWQRNFTNTGPKINSQGNANYLNGPGQDLLVNQIDLAAWQFQYGMTVFPTIQTVPEPGCLLLAMAIAAGVVASCRKFNRKHIRLPLANVDHVSVDREGVEVP